MTEVDETWVTATCVGRRRELEQIDAALAAIESGGKAMAVFGDPGVGKSELLSAAADFARRRGVRVLAASGYEAEAYLPFATLHQLLHPILDQAGDLPEGLRTVLLGAVGFADGSTASNQLFVSLGVLGLVGGVSQSQPTLVLVDDLQWVDAASLDVLQFMARRLDAESVVMLASSRKERSGAKPRLDVERLEIGGLDAASSRELLDRHHPSLTSGDRSQVLQMAAGNPLALLELPTALGRAGPGSERWTSEGVPLTSRLERAFAARVDELDRPTRVLALVAALQGSAKVHETVRVAHELLEQPTESADLDPLVAAGLLATDGIRFEFRHPLVRSAVIHRASTNERRQVHEAFAHALADDPDQATWHRSMAASTEDEGIAESLEAGADRALARGAPLLAGEWLERAAYLSSQPGTKAHRMLRAAEIAFELGQAGSVRRLTSAARVLTLEPPDEARLVGIEAAFDDGVPGGADHVRRLTAAADRAHEGGEDGLAVRLLLGAAKATYWQAADATVTDPIRRAADGLDVAPSDPALIFVRSLLDPFLNGAYIVDQLAAYSQHEGVDPAAAGALSNAGFCAGDFSQALYFARRASDALRQQGRIALLAQTLVLETFSSLYLGRWDITVVASAEAHRFGVETDQPVWAACALLGQGNIAGIRGDADEAELAASSVEQTAILTGNRALLNGAMLVRGHAALGTRSPARAFTELRRMTNPADEAYQAPQCVWIIDLLADAAAQAGQVAEARDVLARFEVLVAGTPAPGIRRMMALARAILADDDDAESLFETASGLAVAAAPWYRARVDLAFGSWLRRHRRVIDSRDRLRSAQLVFDALGARSWSERAREELVAAGDRTRTRAPDGWARLTGQELQIAQLAAQGLSNREIGERLFLSHRTVSSHLYRIFPKLGVRSRAQLRGALGSDGAGQA
jgi:DNA-binding CsgD family transcriptional regulator/DNA-binding transcriptional ArsR family regulator